MEIANELKADMANYESMWGLYEDFNNGLQELAKEDWISFRFLHWFRCFVIFASTEETVSVYCQQDVVNSMIMVVTNVDKGSI